MLSQPTERAERIGERQLFNLDEAIKRALEAFPPIWAHPTERGPHYLTDAEVRVLKLLRLGMTNQEIGDALYISPVTVRTHVKRIHAKCDIKGRARLAVTAFMIWDRGLDRERAKALERDQAIAEGREARKRKREILAEMVA